MTTRRTALSAALGSVLLPAPQAARATAEAQQAALQSALSAFTGGSTPRTGRVTLDIAPLVDNGNAVPVAILVESPMSAADHVQRIGLFAELNPLPDVAVFHLGRHSGVARVATRIRLSTSQTLTALAVMNDGSVWQQQANVIVTLAACIES